MRLLSHPRRLPALALAALLAWLAAMVVAPLTLAPGTVAELDGRENKLDHLERWRALPPFHALVYGIGDILCHQKSWRSFELGGNQMPVDERMTAIFAAAAPGLALTLALPVTPYVSRSLDALLPAAWRSEALKPASRKWTLLVVLALLPAALDVAWENLLGHESNALARVLTGSLAGVAGGLVLGAFLASFDHVFGRRVLPTRAPLG
ncbi:MAG TPA: DUF2085 domain-containing protein [Candidatus Thermoplasmatota archaeon]|nr:DUF2085 domain-containing protein [Candidatus Thermoplasmatota archaeon]